MDEYGPSGNTNVPNSGGRRIRHPLPTAARTLLAATVAFSAILMAIVVLLPLLTGGETGDLAMRLITAVVVLGLASLIVRELIADRPLAITREEIVLPRAIRLPSGVRERRIRFSEISDVEPSVVQGFNGVYATLRDGTRFFLPQSALGPTGLDMMEDFCSRFGRSYRDTVKTILAEGSTGYGFPIASVRRVQEDSIILRRSIRTFSARNVRKIPADAITRVEKITTPYIGSARLVTLEDGTALLIRETDRAMRELERMPRWSRKFGGNSTD